MERKLTILMRALLAVALVAITLVLTYEFWRAGNGKSWMCRKSACRRLSAGIPHSTKDTKHVSGLPLSTYLPTLSSCYSSSQRLPS